MHKLIIWCLVVLLPLSASLLAQNSESGWKFKADITARTSHILHSQRINLQAGIAAGKAGHYLRLAPIFQIVTNQTSNKPFTPRLTGGSIGYEREINTEYNFLKQYFFYEGTLQYFNVTWESNYFNEEAGVYQPANSETHELLSSHLLGLGAKIRFFKDFFAYTSVGAGIYVSDLAEFNDQQELALPERVDFRGYPDFGFNYKVSFGIGYHFN